ncbi:MAG TPA: hypothetical protein VK468_01110, partial [Pyrinomonadaceae bacterium]|nr:hypothetical protein [Pyrinomonadaceae bacterium]
MFFLTVPLKLFFTKLLPATSKNVERTAILCYRQKLVNFVSGGCVTFASSCFSMRMKQDETKLKGSTDGESEPAPFARQ